MIEIQNISKAYVKNGPKAVDRLSLKLPNGKIFGLLGPNGAGKTTTLKMITGILKPDAGDVIINGHSILSDDLAAKKEFAFVPDEPNAFLRLKGIEYLNFICNIYNVPVADRKARISRLAQVFGLDNVLNNQISSYSHGMRQKIFVIGALVLNPPVWILDEPMTGLDPKSAYTLKEMMRQHADQGNVVLFSTHVLDVAEKVCDEVIIIDNGKVLAQGTLEEIRQTSSAQGSLEDIFLQLTEGDSVILADEQAAEDTDSQPDKQD
ncbi:MAG: ABC transporter ATP-binding protein [Eubacteriales bacterium]|nr:ABC transporter ATP-binding protein [Eubacteriales bacterium]